MPSESTEPLFSKSRSLKCGDVVLHRDGGIAVLERRKEDGTGWWLVASGGLADYVLDGPHWVVLTKRRLRSLFEELTTDDE
jgi:hypothetical protein